MVLGEVAREPAREPAALPATDRPRLGAADATADAAADGAADVAADADCDCAALVMALGALEWAADAAWLGATLAALLFASDGTRDCAADPCRLVTREEVALVCLDEALLRPALSPVLSVPRLARTPSLSPPLAASFLSLICSSKNLITCAFVVDVSILALSRTQARTQTHARTH